MGSILIRLSVRHARSVELEDRAATKGLSEEDEGHCRHILPL